MCGDGVEYFVYFISLPGPETRKEIVLN